MRFRAKGFTSLLLACTFLVVAVSGVILFMTPRGRVANWTGWTLLGLDKHEWAALHINTCLVFLAVALGHLLLNWRLFWSYIRGGTSRVNLKAEMVVAVLATAAVVAGTLYDLPPFSSVVALNGNIKDYWDRMTTAAPAPHADEFTLERLSETVGLSADDLISALHKEGIAAANPQVTLASLSPSNGIVPRDIYSAVAKHFPEAAKSIPAQGGRGMGRGRAGGSGCSGGKSECDNGAVCESARTSESELGPERGWGRGMGMGRGMRMGRGGGMGMGCGQGMRDRCEEEQSSQVAQQSK
ncbi:MAG: DUF4405 domain-containing protein [Rhodopirellula sp.]|nr:DUF4405 domain-containing protein [Rhodopirellula sp.]